MLLSSAAWIGKREMVKMVLQKYEIKLDLSASLHRANCRNLSDFEEWYKLCGKILESTNPFEAITVQRLYTLY
jgi:hypothetical protein